MRLMLVTNNKDTTSYSVYDGKVCVASFNLDKPEYLTPDEVQDLRTQVYDEKA